MSRFYITTPIYYVSDVPHLGHAYTTIVCDALSRYHRMRGEPTRFLTGTDEHGQKIARLAEAHHVTPRAYADKFAEAYQATWRALEVANDDFIRTTDPDHEATVQEVWRRMNKSGAIYLADYEGWYCVACEQFYTEKELKGNDCPVHGRPVEKVKEQSFYFKLSQYRDRLLELYDKHPDIAHHVQLGRAGPRSRQAHHLRVARRAHQLLLGHPPQRRGEAVLGPAGRAHRAHDRQRDHPLSRRLLAGVPDGGRPAAADHRVRARLVDGRRREDVEDARQCRRSAQAVAGYRRRRVPLFRIARSSARQRRGFLARGADYPL